MPADRVYAGQLLEFDCEFTDSNSNPMDPTTVLFSYQVAGGTVNTLTTSSSPAIIRTATGRYYVQVTTAGLAGQWVVEWRGEGAVQAVDVYTFLVLAAIS